MSSEHITSSNNFAIVFIDIDDVSMNVTLE